MSSPVRIALVGCGGMGTRHALAYAELAKRRVADIQLVAVCDGNEAAAARVASSVASVSMNPIRVHTDVDAMLKDSSIEAIDVVLPTWLHHSVAIKGIEAGKHVLVEKPLGITIRAANKIAEAAARSSVVVGVAENLRRIPGNRAVKQLLASGELGAPYHMLLQNLSLSDALTVSAPGAEFALWFNDRRRVGSFQALELGVHEADLLRYWFGEIESVSAMIHRYTSAPDELVHAGMATEDTLVANLRFKSGVLGHLAFSSAGFGPDVTERRITCSDGAIRSGAWINWDHGAVSYRDGRTVTAADQTADYMKALSDAERGELFPDGSYEADNLVGSNRAPLRFGVGAELVDFARAVRRNRPPEVTVDDGRLAVAVAYAFLESATVGREVTIADVLSGKERAWQEPVDAAVNL